MSNRFLTLMPIWSGLILANAITGSAQLPTVPTASEPVTNYYHQVAVVDDYQWLEDAANPAVRDWIHRQNERTRAWFDQLNFHAGVARQLGELLADESASYSLTEHRGGIIFATRFKPPAQQPVLVRLNTVYPPALRQVVFDPNVWNTNGTTAMDWSARPPTDGLWPSACPRTAAKTACCISSRRTRGARCPMLFPASSIRPAAAAPPGTQTARGVFYTRYPHAGRAAGGRSAFLPAGLVPQARHAGQRRHL